MSLVSGDIVVLKSGSFPMTVEGLIIANSISNADIGSIVCTFWNPVHSCFSRETFKESQLTSDALKVGEARRVFDIQMNFRKSPA